MSGICGVLALDGGPATADDLAGMLARLATRGPEGSAVWLDGPVALGHTRLATTPEAQVETLPLRHAPSGSAITGDIRIDNRAELLEALQLATPGRIIGDGELVLRAYMAWGTESFARLLGDFAFAIWDAPRRRLVCARDHAAMRPLVYHDTPGKLFAFASDAHALLRHRAIACAINDERMADFFEGRESFDFTATFFRGIHRLPPAHALVIEDGRLRTWRYWQLDPPQRLTLPSDEAYAEALREVFTGAVSARLRSAEPVGAMLSGGMDSGSTVAVAAPLLRAAGAPPLATFSAVSTDPHCVETRAIRAAQTMAHIDPVSISLEDFGAYRDDLAQMTRSMGQPFDTMPWNMAVYVAARRKNIKVVLDGAGGDTLFDVENMVAWQLRRGDLAQAWREAQGDRMFFGPNVSVARTMIEGARCVVVPQFLRDLRARLTAGSRRRAEARASLLSREFMRQIKNDERRAAYERRVSVKLDPQYLDRRELVMHPHILAARERYDRIAAQAGIEARDPFLDRRLVEFVLTLPPDQMRKDGWPKIVMRRAMAGLLPDAVRWRVGKEHVGWEFADALVASGLIEPSSKGIALTARYLCADAANTARHGPNGQLKVASQAPVRYAALWVEQVFEEFLNGVRDEQNRK